jgi:hypothetical protein
MRLLEKLGALGLKLLPSSFLAIRFNGPSRSSSQYHKPLGLEGDLKQQQSWERGAMSGNNIQPVRLAGG